MEDMILDGWEALKANVNNVEFTIDRSQWTQEKKDKNHKNKKAMTILFASMSRKKKGGKIQHYQSAKEIWETRENYYKRNFKVRSKKVQFNIYKYELFKMKLQEFIIKMTNRLNALLTILKKLKKHYLREEINTKILRILPMKD